MPLYASDEFLAALAVGDKVAVHNARGAGTGASVPVIGEVVGRTKGGQLDVLYGRAPTRFRNGSAPRVSDYHAPAQLGPVTDEVCAKIEQYRAYGAARPVFAELHERTGKLSQLDAETLTAITAQAQALTDAIDTALAGK